MTRKYTKRSLEERHTALEEKKQKLLLKQDRVGWQIGQIADKQQAIMNRQVKKAQVIQ